MIFEDFVFYGTIFELRWRIGLNLRKARTCSSWNWQRQKLEIQSYRKLSEDIIPYHSSTKSCFYLFLRATKLAYELALFSEPNFYQQQPDNHYTQPSPFWPASLDTHRFTPWTLWMLNVVVKSATIPQSYPWPWSRRKHIIQHISSDNIFKIKISGNRRNETKATQIPSVEISYRIKCKRAETVIFKKTFGGIID